MAKKIEFNGQEFIVPSKIDIQGQIDLSTTGFLKTDGSNKMTGTLKLRDATIDGILLESYVNENDSFFIDHYEEEGIYINYGNLNSDLSFIQINSKQIKFNPGDSTFINMESGNIDVGNRFISGVRNGMVSSHAVNKGQLDTAVNELNSKIENIGMALVFDNEEQLIQWINGTYVRPDGKTVNDLIIGQYLLTIPTNEPDYWVSELPVNSLNDLTPFSVEVDLSNYYNKQETNDLLDDKLSLSGGSMSGNINMDGNSITKVDNIELAAFQSVYGATITRSSSSLQITPPYNPVDWNSVTSYNFTKHHLQLLSYLDPVLSERVYIPIKDLGDPVEDRDAVNKQTLDNALANLPSPTVEPPLLLKGNTIDLLTLENTDNDLYSRMMFKGNVNSYSIGVGNSNATIEDLRNKFYVYDYTNGRPVMTIEDNGKADFYSGSGPLVRKNEISNGFVAYSYDYNTTSNFSALRNNQILLNAGTRGSSSFQRTILDLTSLNINDEGTNRYADIGSRGLFFGDFDNMNTHWSVDNLGNAMGINFESEEL